MTRGVGERGVQVLHLLAAFDRLVVAAIDIADADADPRSTEPAELGTVADRAGVH